MVLLFPNQLWLNILESRESDSLKNVRIHVEVFLAQGNKRLVRSVGREIWPRPAGCFVLKITVGLVKELGQKTPG